jgi:hypothetical protein
LGVEASGAAPRLPEPVVEGMPPAAPPAHPGLVMGLGDPTPGVLESVPGSPGDTVMADAVEWRARLERFAEMRAQLDADAADLVLQRSP